MGRVFYKGDTLRALLPYTFPAIFVTMTVFESNIFCPEKGTKQWGMVVAKLKKAPRFKSVQSEVALYIRRGGISIKASLEDLRKNLLA